MRGRRTYRVKDVARLAGVSVRTLHYYDQVGLLTPHGRSAAGYRIYSEADLLRLQQIVIRRELGFPLEEIRSSLDDPGYDPKAALLAQRRELERRAERTRTMLQAIDSALSVLEGQSQRGATMSTTDMQKLFDGFDPSAHEEEAEQRWGSTEAFAIAKARTAKYTEADWKVVKAEQAAVYTDLAAALAAGWSAGDARVAALAERHRQVIDRWFYPCDAAMHRNLADLYEGDPRFAANIDRYGAAGSTLLAAASRQRP